MRKGYGIIALLALVTFAIAAQAQTTLPATEAAKPFGLGADHNGLNTDGYRLYICPGTVTTCSTKVGADIPVPTGGSTISIPAPGMGVGTYTAMISAFNAAVEVKSDPFTFRTLAAPVKPELLAS